MHGFWLGEYAWIWGLVNLVFWILILGGGIWLVVWAVRRSSSGGGSMRSDSAGSPSAKEIAQMRYARGEISRDEYQQLLEDLSR